MKIALAQMKISEDIDENLKKTINSLELLVKTMLI